jgi:hypothetical protein
MKSKIADLSFPSLATESSVIHCLCIFCPPHVGATATLAVTTSSGDDARARLVGT